MNLPPSKIRRLSYALALAALLPLASCAHAQTPAMSPARAEKIVQSPDYLSVARLYADTLIGKGRDRYGAQNSPLFAVTLNPELTLYKEVPPAPEGIRVSDRVIWGANPMHDQNLYQVLYALSRVTGDPKYSQQADETLRWFFDNCQSEKTGLMAWGEHLGWDFRRERVTVKSGKDYPPDQFKPGQLQDDIHEFYRPWVLWDKSYQLAPAASAKFAQGLWDNQIYDPKTGQFNRHAGYSAHKPEKDAEFPRHGGFYIETWAQNYARTKNPQMLTAIETVIGYFEAHRDPQTGALSAEGKTPELLWPQSNLSLAISLENAAPAVPEPLAARMRALAASTDAVFFKMDHQLQPDGLGFIKTGGDFDAATRFQSQTQRGEERVLHGHLGDRLRRFDRRERGDDVSCNASIRPATSVTARWLCRPPNVTSLQRPTRQSSCIRRRLARRSRCFWARTV